MRYLVTVVDTTHPAWDELTNDRGRLAPLVYALVEMDEVEATEEEVDLLRSWLVRLGAEGIVAISEV